MVGEEGSAGSKPAAEVVVRRLRSEDVDLLRRVRLAALQDSPDAFGETLEGALTANWSARAVGDAVHQDRALFVATIGALPIGMVFVKCSSASEPAFILTRVILWAWSSWCSYFGALQMRA
jgi:hypothetical protein